MNKFCGKCGAPVDGAVRFCSKCGSSTGSSEPAHPDPGQSLSAPSPGEGAARKGMSTGAKLAIAAVAILVIGGGAALAGVFYVAHKANQKYQEMKAEITGTPSGAASSTEDSDEKPGSLGDPCRYLSKQDVSAAIGAEIVKIKADGESCAYLAKGNEGDMAAKHASVMLGGKGADAKTQQMAEQFGKMIFNSMPQDKQNGDSDSTGSVVVLSVSVTESAAAQAEMKLNAKVLQHLGGSAAPATGEDLSDIGDQAFVTSDSTIMVRKGNKIIRILYMTCPCGTKQVVPLAKKLADAI